MLNLRFLFNIILIAFLVFIQVFLFDKLVFEQIAVPYVYILFVLLYPTGKNRFLFLTLCFLLGWGVDIFENTGGIHAFACITVGGLRNGIIRMVSGTKYFEIDEFRFGDFSAMQWLMYTIPMVFVHHFSLFFIESLSFTNIDEVLLRTLYCSIFTLIFVYFYLILFRKRAER